VKEKLAAYTAALNRFDLAAAEQMFAEDATYVSSGLGGEIRTRAAIMAAFRTYFNQHADQRNYDEDVRQIDEHTLRSKWRLETSFGHRSGIQKVTFDKQGLITRIEVIDDGTFTLPFQQSTS
jgi:SnoaL-like domain